MRYLLLLSTLALLAWLGSCTPINPERRLINRPRPQTIFRTSRATQYHANGRVGVKGGDPKPPVPSLRKGEYVCGDKICKLRPGDLPPGCNGICQYPIRP